MGEKFIEFSSFVIVLRLSYDVKVASLINQRKYEFFRTGYVNVTQLFTIDDFLRNWKMFRSFQFNDDISNFIRISFFFFRNSNLNKFAVPKQRWDESCVKIGNMTFERWKNRNLLFGERSVATSTNFAISNCYTRSLLLCSPS